MKNLIRGQLGLLVGVACASVSMTVGAADSIIFNNTSPTGFQSGYFNPGTTEVGDQIYFGQGGLAPFRSVTGFNFQYWSASTDANWGVQARLKFYANDGALFDGAYASPGTVLYDSGYFALPLFNGYQVLSFGTPGDFPAVGIQVPQTSMTWTIQFQGADVNDTYGLALFTSPTVGTDPSDYWQYVSGAWQLATNTLVPDMSFGAVVTAAPEPSSFALSILGGLGLLAWTRRMRNQK